MIKAQRIVQFLLLAILALTMAGCSRTVEDINKWKQAGNEDKLIKALEDPKAEVRSTAANALGELKSRMAALSLSTLFDDTDTDARHNSATALVEIGGAESISYLKQALALPDDEMRRIAAAGLGSLNATSSETALINALSDDVDSVRCAAAKSLSQVGTEKASKPLVDKQVGGSDNLRLEITKALANTKGAHAVNGLVLALGDTNENVADAAVESLITIGAADVKEPLCKALKSPNDQVRIHSIKILKKTDAIPTEGSDFVWHTLAKASINFKGRINSDVVRRLSSQGMSIVDPLVEAVAHTDPTIREHAFSTLEALGEHCTVKLVVVANEAKIDPLAIAWFKERKTWEGYPSWRLDLWAAATAMNPDFKLETGYTKSMQNKARQAYMAITDDGFKLTRENIPYLIALLGDDTQPPPPQADVDEFGMPVIKKKVDKFQGIKNQWKAQEHLVKIGEKAVYPLIAALQSSDDLVRENAAGTLAKIGDKRAVEPLINSVKSGLASDENIEDSQLYSALLSFNAPEAEPLVMRIRPNTDRIAQVIERNYPGINVKVCEKRDFSSSNNDALKFHLGYSDGGKDIHEATVIFSKDEAQDWVPTPSLPDTIAELSE